MQPEKTVFISHRRRNQRWAKRLHDELEARGYDCFLDVNDLIGGKWKPQLLNQIAARAHFIVILTPEAVQWRNKGEDVFREEIEYALDLERNIIPLMFDGFNYSDVEDYLTGKLSRLKEYESEPIKSNRIKQVIDRLINKYLITSSKGVIYPTPIADHGIVSQAKTLAEEQPEVTEAELEAEQFYEQARKRFRPDDSRSNNPYEAIHLLNKAITLKPDYVAAYNLRATILSVEEGRNEEALQDFSKALKFEPDNWEAYSGRAHINFDLYRFADALKDYNQLIRLAPDADAYFHRGVILFSQDDIYNAKMDFDKAIQLGLNFADVYLFRYRCHKKLGDVYQAILDRDKFLELQPFRVDEI